MRLHGLAHGVADFKYRFAVLLRFEAVQTGQGIVARILGGKSRCVPCAFTYAMVESPADLPITKGR